MELRIPRARLVARVVDPAHPPDPGLLEGLLVSVSVATSPHFALREGFPEASWGQLLDVAGRRGLGLASLLAILAEEAEDDLLDYRRRLLDLFDPEPGSECHYMPHPASVDGVPAVVFVPPLVGETGRRDWPSMRRSFEALRPATLDVLAEHGRRALDGRFQEPAQVEYVRQCLLAGAHGVVMADLYGSGPPTCWPEDWREPEGLRRAFEEERRALVELVGEFRGGRCVRALVSVRTSSALWRGPA